MKKIAVVPTLLTLGNGICGFVAITWASKITPQTAPADVDFCFLMAGWFIIFAMVFDMLDGYVARLSKTASKFGGELDSLCDAISFGVAPAFMLLKMGPDWDQQFLHTLVAGIAALYMCCTILRLARFNVDNSPDPESHKRFRGLPSPGAAGCLASLSILRGAVPSKIVQSGLATDMEGVRQTVQHVIEMIAPAGGLLVALLMVSLVSYPHVTKQVFRGRRSVRHLVQILMAVLIIVLLRDLVLAAIFWGYAILFPLRGLALRASLANRPAELPTQPGMNDPGHGLS